MSDVTRILSAIERGDAQAADELLPLVYEELRRLAAGRMAGERPDHSLDATALVHEAWLRLAGENAPHDRKWNGRTHFFAAAAEAMRRVLIDHARKRVRQKRGGGLNRQPLTGLAVPAPEPFHDLLDLHEALARLEADHPRAALVVKLRYFAGLSIPDVAGVLEVSPRKADQLWAFARVWLLDWLEREGGAGSRNITPET